MSDGERIEAEQRNAEPERYVRIAITKNTKGYQHETTVSIRGCISVDEIRRELQALNGAAYDAAREEIATRETAESNAVNGVAARVSNGSPIAESVADLPF